MPDASAFKTSTSKPAAASSPTLRSPPRNSEVETALLGAIFVNNAAYHRVSDFLLPEHFAEGVNGRIFAAAGKLIERGQIANPVTLKLLFEQDEALGEVGAAQYLAHLAASMVTIINAGDYGRTIHDLYLRRQLISIGEDTVNDAYTHDLERDARNQIEQAEKRLFELASAGSATGGGLVHVGAAAPAVLEAIDQAFKAGGRIIGLPTGLSELDNALGGLHPGTLIVLGGQTSMGKTSLATGIMKAAARHLQQRAKEAGKRPSAVAFFSLEMPRAQIWQQLVADYTGISIDRQNRGDLKPAEFVELTDASRTIHALPLFVDETPQLGIVQIRSRARRLARQSGLGLVVIDHLQKMRETGRPADRRLEIGDDTNGASAMAKELDVPVVLLSQLSRALEQRANKRPVLADLQESGAIEQDADVVLFVYRHEKYLKRDEPTINAGEKQEKFNDRRAVWEEQLENAHGMGEIIIAKNRNGPICNIDAYFREERMRFEDLDWHERHGAR